MHPPSTTGSWSDSTSLPLAWHMWKKRKPLRWKMRCPGCLAGAQGYPSRRWWPNKDRSCFVWRACIGAEFSPLFQVIDHAANLQLDLHYPNGTEELLLYFHSRTGNVELGLELDFWMGAYQDPLLIRLGNIRSQITKVCENHPQKPKSNYLPFFFFQEARGDNYVSLL